MCLSGLPPLPIGASPVSSVAPQSPLQTPNPTEVLLSPVQSTSPSQDVFPSPSGPASAFDPPVAAQTPSQAIFSAPGPTPHPAVQSPLPPTAISGAPLPTPPPPPPSKLASPRIPYKSQSLNAKFACHVSFLFIQTVWFKKYPLAFSKESNKVILDPEVI